jgi:hypothetical protein
MDIDPCNDAAVDGRQLIQNRINPQQWKLTLVQLLMDCRNIVSNGNIRQSPYL